MDGRRECALLAILGRVQLSNSSKRSWLQSDTKLGLYKPVDTSGDDESTLTQAHGISMYLTMLLCKRFCPLFNGDATGSILPYSCGSLRWCYAMGAKLVVARLQLELAKCQGITPLASTCHHIFRAKQVDLWTAAAKGGDGGKTSMSYLRLLLGFLASPVLTGGSKIAVWDRASEGFHCNVRNWESDALLWFQYLDCWDSSGDQQCSWAIGPLGRKARLDIISFNVAISACDSWLYGMKFMKVWMCPAGVGCGWGWMVLAAEWCVSSSSNNWPGSGKDLLSVQTSLGEWRYRRSFKGYVLYNKLYDRKQCYRLSTFFL